MSLGNDNSDGNANGDTNADTNGAHARKPDGRRALAPYEHVLVTGAGGAIGGALARAMRAAWPRTRLALLDLDAEAMQPLCEELGDADVYGADLRAIETLADVVAAISARGAIDGLVNCAGIMRVQQVSTWKWEEASDLLAIDLLAPLRLQDLVVRGMVQRGHGVIVNVASMAGKVPLRGCAYYGASKAGLAMASEIARADLAGYGVRVVTVYPGPVKSPLEQGARDAYGKPGILARIAPTGDATELARRIMVAIEKDEPRVIYPRLYNVGWSATPFASWFSLSFGPPPLG